jgi:hypothetical protein
MTQPRGAQHKTLTAILLFLIAACSGGEKTETQRLTKEACGFAKSADLDLLHYVQAGAENNDKARAAKVEQTLRDLETNLREVDRLAKEAKESATGTTDEGQALEQLSLVVGPAAEQIDDLRLSGSLNNRGAEAEEDLLIYELSGELTEARARCRRLGPFVD